MSKDIEILPVYNHRVADNNDLPGKLFRTTKDALYRHFEKELVTREEAARFISKEDFFKDSSSLQNSFLEWLFTTAGE